MDPEKFEQFVRSVVEKRKPSLSKRQRDQLEKEIRSFSLSLDFLEVYVEWMKSLSGKSGPLFSENENNLIVPWLLGITSKKPSLNEPSVWSQFGDCPDIDTDIEDRDRAYALIQNIFGIDRVGAVSNFNAIKLKMAFKDIARLYDIDPKRVDRITTRLSKEAAKADTVDLALKESEDLGKIFEEYPAMREDVELLLKLGPYRNMSRHAGGVIVADSLFDISPMQRQGDVIQVGYSKKNCEKMGLIKLDLLGLKTLRIINDCIHEIIYQDYENWRQRLEEHVGDTFTRTEEYERSLTKEETDEVLDEQMERDSHGMALNQDDYEDPESVRILATRKFDPFKLTPAEFLAVAEEDEGRHPHRFQFIKAFYDLILSPEVIDFDDQKVYETVYQSGRFCGVFQMDSEGMRKTTMSFSPNCIDDISAAVAIYRPGPLKAGVNELYATNKQRYERGDKDQEHPLIDENLEDTYGLLVYQEQIMALCADLGLYEPRLVQRMRQNVIKKGKDKLTPDLAAEREMLKVQFLKGAEENGYPEDKAEILWEKIENFAAYSFNLSHSFCYGVISFITAYLLTYYRLEWYTSVLNNTSDPKKLGPVIAEVQSDGVEILPPDIVESKTSWAIANGKIRFGLGNIKEVGDKAAATIIRGQRGDDENEGFQNVWEFLQHPLVNWRNVNTKVLRALVRSGCFDSQEEFILEHFKSMKAFHDTISNNKPASYRKLFTEHGPEIAIEKLHEKYERWEKRHETWRGRQEEYEVTHPQWLSDIEEWGPLAKKWEARTGMLYEEWEKRFGGKKPKESPPDDLEEPPLKPQEPKEWKEPPEPPMFWDEEDWPRAERLSEMARLLNYLPPPENVIYHEYSVAFSKALRTEKREVLSTTIMSVDDFLDKIESEHTVYPVDDHPGYHKESAIPLCWFRIINISKRTTKTNKEYIVIKAMGEADSVDIKCWQPYLFEEALPTDYYVAFVEFDPQWGYSIMRSSNRKKYPVFRHPATD